jgi:adenosylmethionine-8-amino-7-oxononanoate aminotransferase
LIRTTGDTIALAPPLIAEPAQIDAMFGAVGDALRTIH